jgi:hypothetical protein
VPATWSARDYATGQFYHVAATRHLPYHVCGAQQDSSTMCVSSATGLAPAGGGGRGGGGGGRRGGGPAVPEPYGVGGAEPGYIAPDPKDIDVFYAGGNNGSFMTKINRRTGENREVGAYPQFASGEPSSAMVERWQWTYPIIFSPVDPNVLYTGSQHVWKTVDGGKNWQKISPDLTRHDPKTLGHSGGPITGDMNGPEVYAVVFAIAPGRKDVNVIWAGSDDGRINVTADGGKSWSNVTPKDMPDFGRVSIIEAGSFESGTAYAAVKRPLLNDIAPYIFRTHDFGKTWTKIVNGIASNDYVHAVREDPARKGLLYAATQHGVYVSYDDGDNWQSLSLNLPEIPVSDLLVEPTSLAISTHGRGFYILENIQPLRQAVAAVAASDAYLFAPAPAIRSATGARLEYWLKHPAQSLTVEVLDSAGHVIRSFNGAVPTAGGGRGGRGAAGADPSVPQEFAGGRGGRGGATTASMAAGLNAVTWNLLYPDAVTFPGMILWGATTQGPAAVPGHYSVRLTADGKTQTQPFLVQRHPLFTDVSQADYEAQFRIAIAVRDKVSEANNAVIQIRNLKKEVADRLTKSADPRLKATGDSLTARLGAVEEEIYQVRNQSNQDPLNFPIKINNRIASLLEVVDRGDGRPTGNVGPIFTNLKAELKVQTDRLQKVIDKDLAALNAELKRLGLAPISATSKPIA